MKKMADFCGFAGVFCARGGKSPPKMGGVDYSSLGVRFENIASRNFWF